MKGQDLWHVDNRRRILAQRRTRTLVSQLFLAIALSPTSKEACRTATIVVSKLRDAPKFRRALTVRNPRLRVKQFDHPSFVVFLLAQVVPSVLAVVERDVAFPNIVRLHNVRGSKIPLCVHGSEVTESQGPFFDRRNEWPPHAAVVSVGSQYKLDTDFMICSRSDHMSSE